MDSGRLQVGRAEWFAGDMVGQIALAPDFFRFPYSPQIAFAIFFHPLKKQ
jgi:hypothetical protein